MLTGRYHFSVTSSDRRIVCLGGRDLTHPLHTVHKYNPATDTWHSMSSMSITRCGLTAASVYVPLIMPDLAMIVSPAFRRM